jgi:predicted nucleotidyltransferase
MIFRGVPEAVFSSPAKLAVLRELVRAPHREFTGREISRLAAISAPWGIRILKSFEQLGLVRRTSDHRADLWRLNQEHALVPEIQNVLGADQRLWNGLLRELRPLVKDRGVEKAAIFGSMARGDATADSDVDLLLVVRDRRAKTRVRHAAFDAGLVVLRRFGNPVQALVYTRAEWARLGKRGFAPAARREGIVLKGGPL